MNRTNYGKIDTRPIMNDERIDTIQVVRSVVPYMLHVPGVLGVLPRPKHGPASLLTRITVIPSNSLEL
jgi:hypothetical protein